MTAWKEKMPTFPAGVYMFGKTPAIVRAGREDDRRETEGLWNESERLGKNAGLLHLSSLEMGRKGLQSHGFELCYQKQVETLLLGIFIDLAPGN